MTTDRIASFTLNADGTVTDPDAILVGERDSLVEATTIQVATLKPELSLDQATAKAEALVDAQYQGDEIAAGASTPASDSAPASAPAAPQIDEEADEVSTTEADETTEPA